MPGTTVWIVVPLLGGVIGFITNYLAVKMIFRPLEPRSFLGLRFHGLVPRRQTDLARSIGRVVGGHLVQAEDLARALGKVDLSGVVDGALERGLEPKLAELRRLPMIGAFLTEDRVGDLRKQIVSGLMSDQEGLIASLEGALEEGLDVDALVEEKVAAFPVERLEQLILEVASRELKSIVWLGGVLGLLIGFVQVALLHLLSS